MWRETERDRERDREREKEREKEAMRRTRDVEMDVEWLGERRKDGRLFADLPLYCEGFPKPVCRGVLHLSCALLLPTALLFFARACQGSLLALAVSVAYLLSNLVCYGASGIYHIFDWKSNDEILLQKIDHCGIAILSVGTILPDSILLFGSELSPEIPNFVGFVFAGVSVGLCAYTCSQIMKQKPEVFLQAVVAVWWVVPFLLPNFYHMTTVEFSCMLLCCLFQCCGVLTFTKQSPDPFPSFFGYHEIFHVFTVLAGVCVLICNYSIVERYGIAYKLGKVSL